VKWRTLSEIEVPDIHAFIREAAAMGQSVHLGTDSLQTGRFTPVLHRRGRPDSGQGRTSRLLPGGGTEDQESARKLLKETWKSVDLGIQLTDIVPGDLTVHVDANPVQTHKSSAYLQELVGLVVGQGFKAQIKPDAWCASHAADHIVRHHGKLPQAS